MERVQGEVVVKNAVGLHIRPAADFVQIASKFNSKVKIGKHGEFVDGKSIIGILSLGINEGAKVELLVEGDDARNAFEELRSFLEKDGRKNS